MADQPSRKRRFAKRAVMALSVPILVLSGYVGAWLSISVAYQHGVPHVWRITPAFTPLVSYSNSGLPGGDAMARLWYLLNVRDNGEVSIGVAGTYLGPEPRRGDQVRWPSWVIERATQGASTADTASETISD